MDYLGNILVEPNQTFQWANIYFKQDTPRSSSYKMYKFFFFSVVQILHSSSVYCFSRECIFFFVFSGAERDGARVYNRMGR